MREGLPPGSRLPALVQTVWFLSNPGSYLRAMRRRFGDVLTLRSIYGPVVIGCTPEHARQLFSTEPDALLPFGPGALNAVLGDSSVLVTSGEQHRRQRKLLVPPFHGAKMRAQARTMQQVARQHLGPLRAGQTARMVDVTTSISLDIILRTIFGLDEAELAEGRELLRGVLDEVSAVALVLFSAGLPRERFAPWQRMVERRARYAAMVDRLVTERRARGQHGDDVLGTLLDASWEDGSPLTVVEIRDQLITLLVAGHETSAIAIAWAVHDLYQRPAALARLRAELDSLGPDPEPDAIARLPFLGAVCDESLRHHSMFSDISRTVREPIDFGGHRLPPGVGVAVAVEAIHADAAVYPGPDEFRPERFLEGRPGPFEFMPFGGGHRRCPGAAFADQEMRLVVALIASSLDMEVLGTDRRVRRNVTMGPRRGVPVRVVATR